MTETLIVGLLSLTGTLIGSIAGIMTANKLTNYRIEQLEQKVQKHNEVVERVALLEMDNKNQWGRIDELKNSLKAVYEETK